MTIERRAFVLGISGATWDVMRPMIENGDLPNIEMLCRTGVSGTLASVRAQGDKHFRPQTAWPSLATGCLPEHHGVRRFFHTSEDLERPTIWQLISDSGRTVGLFGWPMTWPPRPINGFDIPCHHSRDGRTWPPELEIRQESSDRLSFRRGLSGINGLARQGAFWPMLPRLAKGAWRMAIARSSQRRGLVLAHLKQEAACELFRTFYSRFQPSVASFVTFLVDTNSHRYWRYHDPTLFPAEEPEKIDQLGSAMEDAYKKVDMFLGRIMQVLPKETIVAVVSENGMAPETTPAEIGPWQYAINGNSLRVLLGLPDDVECRPIARWLSFRKRDGTSMPPDTVSRMLEIRVVETGLPLFQVYEHRGEVIVKFDLSHAVSSLCLTGLEELRVCYRGQEMSFLAIGKRANPQRSAMHAEGGVLVIAGPGIQRDRKIEGARIIDFAPTLLSALGFSFPEVTFDGATLDIFCHA